MWMKQRVQVVNITRVQLKCLLPLYGAFRGSHKRPRGVRNQNHLFENTRERRRKAVRFFYLLPAL